MEEFTRLLEAAQNGDLAARDAVFERAYAELCVLARNRLSRESTLTDLDTGSLVHEAWMRLSRQAQLPASNRRAFFAYAAQTMRSVIVDYVRQRNAAKRGAGVTPVTLVTRDLGEHLPAPDIEALDEALRDLQRVDARCAQVVELRFFGGLEFEAIAEVLGVSRSTVTRAWDKARLFLYQALRGS